MKKKIIIIGSITTILFGLAFGLATFMVGKVESFKKLTHSDVLATKKMRDHYGIGTKGNPADYGYENYKTYKYKSVKDKTELEAWYVDSTQKNPDHNLLIIHGHHANKLRTTKYLDIVKKYKLDAKYSIMIPDMRNSGNSQKAPVSMGYLFAEDIYTSMIFINKTFGTKKFTLYAFSLGAMGTMVLLDRKDLMDDLKKKGISIEKIIFDSPLTNTRESLIYLGTQKGFPEVLLSYAFWAYNIKRDGYPSKMRLHKLYKKITIPLLILQAKDDPKDFYNAMQKEMKLFKNDAIRVQTFETGHHVKIYQNPRVKALYTKTVVNFLK